MRIAAIFIEDQDRPERGYTVNLGGKYYYEVQLTEDKCVIDRKENKVFIDNLFDKYGIVKNVSAIVGENGSGKTTLIRTLIEHLNGKQPGICIWEEEGDVCVSNYRIPSHSLRGSNFNIKQCDLVAIDTIYYSPFIDHKALMEGINISADSYLESDLENIQNAFEAQENIVISDRLRRSDYKRFMRMQNSEFYGFLSQSYGLFKDDGLYRVLFTRHKISVDNDSGEILFHNTPKGYRDFLSRLYRSIRREYEELNTTSSSDEELYDLNKKRFKNLILMDIFCLLISLMERNGEYLQKGKFNSKTRLANFQKKKKIPAYDQLIFWLNNYCYDVSGSKQYEYPLPGDEVIDIINFLHEKIDSFEYLDFTEGRMGLDWGSKYLYLDEETLDELLELNEKLLARLSWYYVKNKHIVSVRQLQHFVSIEFANRRLSSGETAMLNLYSKLHDYFVMVINNQSPKKADVHYVLFLDEADMGYHPSWKVTYIDSIVKFCKEFFAKNESKVQIVFSTHDPLSLSDIPSTNIVCLHKSKNGIMPIIIKQGDNDFPKHSFAANVTDLLSDSFFLKRLMGDFAYGKINELIKWLNNLENKDDQDYYKNILKLIDEPLLRYKLEQMYYEKFPKEFNTEQIKKRIKELAEKGKINIKFD